MYGSKKCIYQKKKVVLSVILAVLILLPSTAIGNDYPDFPGTPAPADTDFDDCDSVEVMVGEIISPPSSGMTGAYDITANFTAVEIIINGIRDYDENEPWIEHELSPDNNGTPHVHFYTSCDEDYMYVAFENQTDGILAGELFIDKNMNNTWDGPSEDSFFTINYIGSNNDKVKDHNGHEVPNSMVGWGDQTFVEIKIPKVNWSICNDWAYRVISTPVGDCSCSSINLPLDPVTMSVILGTDSYFITTLSNVPLGYDVANGDYIGWCVDQQHSINHSGKEYSVALWCSYDPLMPWLDDDWDMVNYIINHKHPDATMQDIQDAIWYFVNGGNDPSTDIGWSMVENATNFGEGFEPLTGEVCAILCDAGSSVQKTFIEVLVPAADDGSWNPSWGNNSAPSTPPDNEFLTFTCDYNGEYSCPCGVGFKALADVYEIVPGDYATIYETDFENSSNVSNEWIAYSLDGNPDTWELSEDRSHSSSHGYHCTNNTIYFGDAYDILQMKNSLDLSDVNNVSFSFWHWCEGDTYTSNNQEQIADYGDVELYTYIESSWSWISLSDLGISNLYYDNGWVKAEIDIEISKLYPLNGENISGDTLLTSQAKFRFVWKSDPQFQFEGWYIDDVKIVVGEHPHNELIWQTHYVYWCVSFGSTITRTFPMQWNADKEGKYLVRVCVQEEPPWCGMSCNEKIVTIGNIHDVAVTSLSAADAIEEGDDLFIEAVVKNVGTYIENNIQVKATLKKNGNDPPVWQETITIPKLNVSEEKTLNFTWEDASYCDYLLEVRAIHPDDEVPENNSKSKWILVATTLFEDDMDDECCWDHFDLTGGEGHWGICTSGDDDYLWCGIPETTKYGNNWNDVATINESIDLSPYSAIYLNFTMHNEIVENDKGYVEISKDGGRHWDIIAEYTGNSDWEEKSYDISTYNTSDVVIRFRFFSNESITDRGWIINDVSIVGDGTIRFSDDFELGTGKWIIERLRAGDWWQRVVKSKIGDPSNIAYWCGDELAGMYPANLDNVLVLKSSFAIDLSKAFEADVVFSTWYNISEGDLGTLEISDDDGASWDLLDSFTGESGGWTTKSADITSWIGGDIRIRFRFMSDDSSESEGWYVDDVKIVAKLDFDPPVTSCTLAGTMGQNDWYTSTVQITLTAVDGGSGVKNTYYKLDGGIQTTYTSPITVSGDGPHTIEYWSVDNVDNTETHSSESFKIDTQAPTVNITKPDVGIYWRDRKIWPLIEFSLLNWSTPFIIRDITIVASANDATSGIDRVEFYIDSVLESTDTTAPYEWNWDETVFFTHTIEVKAYDAAGHMDTASKNVRIFNINLFGN